MCQALGAQNDDHHKANIVNLLHAETVLFQQEVNLISSMKMLQTTSPAYLTLNAFTANATQLNLLNTILSVIYFW